MLATPVSLDRTFPAVFSDHAWQCRSSYWKLSDGQKAVRPNVWKDGFCAMDPVEGVRSQESRRGRLYSLLRFSCSAQITYKNTRSI